MKQFLMVLVSVFAFASLNVAAQTVTQASSANCNPQVCCPSNTSCCTAAVAETPACQPKACCPTKPNCCAKANVAETQTAVEKVAETTTEVETQKAEQTKTAKRTPLK